MPCENSACHVELARGGALRHHKDALGEAVEAFGAGGQALLQTPTSHGHRPTAPCLLLLLLALAAATRYAQQ